ncbi:MAG TPA: pectate lyase [Polyangiaceae bacterium]
MPAPRFVLGLPRPLVACLALLGNACSSAPAVPDADAGAGGGGGTAPTGGTSGTAPSGGSGGTGAVPAECTPAAVPVTTPWESVNRLGAAFYGTPEALTIAQNILYYQNADRGWPKDTDMTTRTKGKSRSTIDNGATTTQVEFLSRVYGATECEIYRDAAVSGLEYLFSGQYENGGWPQEFPNGDGYHTHITFNDDAMLHVLTLLRVVSERAEPYAYLDESYAPRAAEAVQKGIDCILRCQVVSDTQAGWCAQHDEATLAPAPARTYELPSLSGSEGVGIVRFLMTIDEPGPAVREAIESAVAWFESVKIEGIRVQETTDASQPTGEDRVVVEDPTAPPLWARFYELETNRPIFSSRCEVPECESDPFFMRRYSLAEIENERRVGYSWYGDWPARLLGTDYPAWKAKWPAP